jgi:hypothetical protein
VFGLLSTLAEILSTYATRFLNGKTTAKDVDVAAYLLRIVVSVQDLTVRGERLLDLVEGLVDGDEPEASARIRQAQDADWEQEFVGLLHTQVRAQDGLGAVLEESRPLLATTNGGIAGIRPQGGQGIGANVGGLRGERTEAEQPTDLLRAELQPLEEAGVPGLFRNADLVDGELVALCWEPPIPSACCGAAFASMFTRIVRGPTRSAGTGNVPSRNQRYAVRGATPCALAHSVRFTPKII